MPSNFRNQNSISSSHSADWVFRAAMWHFSSTLSQTVIKTEHSNLEKRLWVRPSGLLSSTEELKRFEKKSLLPIHWPHYTGSCFQALLWLLGYQQILLVLPGSQEDTFLFWCPEASSVLFSLKKVVHHNKLQPYRINATWASLFLSDLPKKA